MEQKIDMLIEMMAGMKQEMTEMKLEMNKRFDKLESDLSQNSNLIHGGILEIRKELEETQNIKKLYSEEALKAVEAM